ncbi:uncharacterized protein AAG666_023467 [Megaptera novaeangliae]
MTGSRPLEDKEKGNSRKESHVCRGSAAGGAGCIPGTIRRPQPGLGRAVGERKKSWQCHERLRFGAEWKLTPRCRSLASWRFYYGHKQELRTAMQHLERCPEGPLEQSPKGKERPELGQSPAAACLCSFLSCVNFRQKMSARRAHWREWAGGGAWAGRARVLTERAGGGAERSGRPTRAAAGAGGAGGAGVAGGGGPGAAGPEWGRAGGGAAAPGQCRLPRGGRSGTASVSAPRPPRRGRAPGAAARQLSGGGGLRGTQRARGRPVRDDCASRPRPPANRSLPDGPAAPRPPGSSSSAAAGPGKVCGASAGRPDPRGLRGASSAGPRNIEPASRHAACSDRFPSRPRHVSFISQWGPGATEPPGTAPASKPTAGRLQGASGRKALETPPAMGPPPPACVRSAGVPVPAASSSTVQIRFQADNWERTPRDRRPGRDQRKNAEWKAVPWTQCRAHWGDFSPEADSRQARVCLSPGPLPCVVKT